MTEVLKSIMDFCFNIAGNYGISIIIFTLITKIILLPLSIWVQKNSIKMVKMQPEINEIHAKYFGNKDQIAEEETALYKHEHYNAFASLIPLIVQIVLLLGVVNVIKSPSQAALDSGFSFLGINLGWITVENWGLSILAPVIAGLSALALCIAQNKMNVLQAEQTKFNKISMLLFSVGLSLYLGFFVQFGVALYWTASNIMAIIQQWLLNVFIDPKKSVDYERLEKSRKALQELKDLGKSHKRTAEMIKKEKADYKRFFSIANKKLVFYSESSGFYKYYKGVIKYILKHTNLTIHYITNDYNDQIFELAKKYPHIKPYYIEEKKAITLMMKMDADVVVMTMPDIQNFHIKRSYVRKDIEYVFYPHSIDSINMTFRKGAVDHYDSVLITGKDQREECEAIFEKHGINNKIVDMGYPLIDDMIRAYNKTEHKPNKVKTIMIAPSWQKDNIIDLCLDDMLKSLQKTKYNIIVRPHPQHVRHMKDAFEKMKEDYAGTNIEIQTDFSKTNPVMEADLLITDWSSIAYEYAFTTERPALFIDTPMKIMNPDYKEIDIEPFNIWARNRIGKVLKVKDVKDIDKDVKEMLEHQTEYKEKIAKFREETIYNIGKSSKVGAKYIIKCVQDQINRRKNND